jgi:hypothetical protein
MIQIDGLTGLYTVVCLGEPLKYFVDNIQFNISHCDETINLLDNFSMLKQGYALEDSLGTMMIIHNKINKLQDQQNKQFSTSNKIMIDAFGAGIPAQYFISKKHGKILMSKAMNLGLVPSMINTFDTIRMSNTDFNHEKFGVYYFQNILSLNIDSNNIELIELIKNKDFTEKLIYEYELISEIFIVITINPTIDLIELLKISILHNYDTLLDYLVKNKYIKLLYDILIRDNNSLISSLLDVDPRDYNYEAYHLCLETKNDIGIELIRKNIIERNWFEKQVFSTNINYVYGQESDLPDNILLHHRSNLF